VDGRKNLKLKKSYLEYVTSSVEESTMEIEVNTNNSSSKDEVDLYALEVVLNHKKTFISRCNCEGRKENRESNISHFVGEWLNE